MDKPDWKKERAEREYQKLLRETAKARCALCGEAVKIEDRCNDGLYLHRDCALRASTR